ncbi:sensor histidine kinase [Streptomyces sp. NBC_01235]|uniref:sensor histidine kinase n=1 Tax=Streptomyces sp. NBC_01235 TaxID=2903788 RepID=UPI002E135550
MLLGPGEMMILLCLLFIAVRHCPPPWSLVCGVLDATALLTLPARTSRSLGEEELAYVVVGLLVIGLVAGLAGYLRSLDYRRTVAVTETRREERLAIAADLHDFVAHHVTGILVQTQVARMMAASRQDELDPVLAGIERAATQALASMRRTVGVLRDTGPETADRRPVGDLAGIAELTEDFATPGQHAVLHRDPSLSDDLPHEVQTAAFRVVQESPTNIVSRRSDCARKVGHIVLLDGTPIRTRRRTGADNRRDYSGKHKVHGPPGSRGTLRRGTCPPGTPVTPPRRSSRFEREACR